MADGVSGGLHTVRHDGTITEHMVRLPIVQRAGVGLITTRVGITHGEVAQENDGRNSVIGFIHPNAIVAAC